MAPELTTHRKIRIGEMLAVDVASALFDGAWANNLS
jgi:hypothetical protein